MKTNEKEKSAELKEKEKSAELYRLESSHEYFDSYELIFTRL